ncbi:MAG: DUF1217 domain-containing protein [Paracoccaceae bacterium]
MSFQPVVLFGGFAGWAFLVRTRDNQQQAFNKAPEVQRDTDYFRENIAGALSAEDLTSDRRLMRIALGAFGLNDDINNTYFIRKVLEGGTLDDSDLANRLSDKRYLALSKAFGFGDLNPANTQLSDFPDKIIELYQNRQFEIAIGEQDQDMRLALGLERELDEILSRTTSDDGYWFLVMGTPQLRSVFETALGLPSALGALDLDQQLGIFRDRAQSAFGNGEVAQFSEPEVRDKLVRRFLALAQLDNGTSLTVPGSVALSLLQSARQNATLF